MEGIFAHLSGHPFRQPYREIGVDSMARHQIETFGRVVKEPPKKGVQDWGIPLEIWRLENESILGARLTRADTFGARLSYNQLIGLKSEGAQSFMLGVTAWVNVTRTGQLQIGLRYLPGQADAISIRATGVNLTVSDKYAPAFLLQSVPALKIPASLVIPRDWFIPLRVVEVLQQNGERLLAKMGFSVEHGLDYERVSFTLV
jgi:hypothetical protein